MRAILLEHTFDATDLWWALGLNAVYLAVGYATFSWFLGSARENGTLLRYHNGSFSRFLLTRSDYDPVAEEVRNPQRNIPLALFGGIGLLIVLIAK